MLNTENRNIDLLISWGLSLVGRAPALHAGGQEFDSPSLHHVLIEYGYKLKITEFSKYKLIKFCDLNITVFSAI